MIKIFRDMDVWKKSHELSISIFKLTACLPRSEDYALTSQIRKSSNSVSANIAEAFGRRTTNDKIYFYKISRGSAYETQNHLLYGVGVEYFDQKSTNNLIDEHNSMIYQLNKIMSKLERNKG